MSHVTAIGLMSGTSYDGVDVALVSPVADTPVVAASRYSAGTAPQVQGQLSWSGSGAIWGGGAETGSPPEAGFVGSVTTGAGAVASGGAAVAALSAALESALAGSAWARGTAGASSASTSAASASASLAASARARDRVTREACAARRADHRFVRVMSERRSLDSDGRRPYRAWQL